MHQGTDGRTDAAAPSAGHVCTSRRGAWLCYGLMLALFVVMVMVGGPDDALGQHSPHKVALTTH